MPTFKHAFTVAAPRAAVADFHADARVLKRLMPPPLFVRLHEAGRLEEGAVADFTLWFGPIPVRWRALHRDVGDDGFTDIQIRGPLQHWQHTHRFIPLDDHHTRVQDRVTYEHPGGARGWLSRLLFNRASLAFLFAYRQYITRRALHRRQRSQTRSTTTLLTTAIAVALLFIAWRGLRKTAAKAPEKRT